MIVSVSIPGRGCTVKASNQFFCRFPGGQKSLYQDPSKMKCDYKFSNLLGNPYTSGNILFAKGGEWLLSPVGNRVALYDLKSGQSSTLDFETIDPVDRISVSPCSSLMIVVDKKGRSLIFNVKYRFIITFITFKDTVQHVEFSPDGSRIAVALGNKVQIWTVCLANRREFSPLHLENTFALHRKAISHLSWSHDGKLLLTVSEDMTGKLVLLDDTKDNAPVSIALAAHKHKLIAGFFYPIDDNPEQIGIITIGFDAVAYLWKFDTTLRKMVNLPNGKLGTMKHLQLDIGQGEGNAPNSHAVSASIQSKLLLLGYENGAFGLFAINDENVDILHGLSMSRSSVRSVSMSPGGDWLGFACCDPLDVNLNGCLVVWEWKSETFVFKQQGHLGQSMTCLDISADGQYIATGGKDSKVKLWSTLSGNCTSTFSDHLGEVVSVLFCKNSKVLLTASNDGRINAYDLARFKLFRTFSTIKPAHFSCMSVDSSGEVVFAGTSDTWEIYMWSFQTGQVMEILTGHTGPIQGLAFDPIRHQLASVSWDKSVRLWDTFSREKKCQVVSADSEVLSVAFHPSGQEVVITTLRGDILQIDAEDCVIKHTIEARKDAWIKPSNKSTHLSANSSIFFTSCKYSPDGTFLLLSGRCPYILLYGIESRTLLKRFPLSTFEHRLQAGPQSSVSLDHGNLHLNGTGGLSCLQLDICQTGRFWAAITGDGLMMYSLDDSVQFDPFDLEIDCTPDSVIESLNAKDWLRSLVFALKLSDKALFLNTFLAIPFQHIDLTLRSLPPRYLSRLIFFLGNYLFSHESFCEVSGRPVWTELERILDWSISVLSNYSSKAKANYEFSSSIKTSTRSAHRFISEQIKSFMCVADENRYLIEALNFKA